MRHIVDCLLLLDGLCTTDWLKSIFFFVYSVKRLPFNSCITLLCAVLNEFTQRKSVGWQLPNRAHTVPGAQTHVIHLFHFCSKSTKKMENIFGTSEMMRSLDGISVPRQIVANAVISSSRERFFRKDTSTQFIASAWAWGLHLPSSLLVVVECINRCIIILALFVATSTTRDEL